ncbi:MAG: amino acid racemase [Treponema sp.]|jgi:aspartate racemase|nr:amino acid racemase [Treponema sp.]
MDTKKNPLIGIIGGIGPYAGLDFLRKIFSNTRAVKDQDHINCILISCPSIIADRTEFLLNGERCNIENPARGMFESAQRLYRAGVEYAAVACNTAHSAPIFRPFSEMVQEYLPGFTVVNMLETCAAFVKESLNINHIGLLASKGTYKSRVYHEYFQEEEGAVLIEPEEQGREKIHEAIYSKQFGIKTYSQPVKPHAKNNIIYEIYRLVERGAQAVILGCTELPLAVDPRDFSVPILDPGLLTARRLITLAAPEKLL